MAASRTCRLIQRMHVHVPKHCSYRGQFLERCWDDDPQVRPRFAEAALRLETLAAGMPKPEVNVQQVITTCRDIARRFVSCKLDPAFIQEVDWEAIDGHRRVKQSKNPRDPRVLDVARRAVTDSGPFNARFLDGIQMVRAVAVNSVMTLTSFVRQLPIIFSWCLFR